MSKKSKNKILIIFIYFISFFIFELIIGVGGIEKTLQYCAETGNVTPLIIYVPIVEAGVYHFIFVSIIAIACVFYKKLDRSYKTIIYFFPMFTFFFSYTMWILTTMFCKVFGLYGLEM